MSDEQYHEFRRKVDWWGEKSNDRDAQLRNEADDAGQDTVTKHSTSDRHSPAIANK
jgi:hypothetical protein